MLPDVNMVLNSTILHLVNARFGDFYAGMLHALTSLEHVLPLVAMGLLAGQLGPAMSRRTMVVFTLALIPGTWMGHVFGISGLIDYANIGSFILLGLLVALQIKVQAPIMIVMAVLFALTHGFSNGTAITANVVPLNFILGVGLTGFLVITLMAGLVLSLKKNWERIAIRVIGSWIAAVGIIYIPLFLRRNGQRSVVTGDAIRKQIASWWSFMK